MANKDGITWDDRLNPVVVKELRQTVRGRFLPTVLMTFLSVQLIAMVTYFNSGGKLSGSILLSIFMSFSLFVMIMVIPLAVGQRITSERSESNMDLLYISTLDPRKIITGKFMAGFIIILLFFTATLPFISLTFLLRGVDLPSVLVYSLYTLLFSAAALQSIILLAYLPMSRVLRVLLTLCAIVFLFTQYVMVATFFAQASQEGLSGFNIWEGLAAIALILAFIFVLQRVAIAIIQPGSANRAKPVRKTLSMIGLLLPLAFFLGNKSQDIIFPLTAVGLALCLVVAICEREQPNARLRRTIPNNIFKRLISFPFFSGAANGTVWCMVSFAILCLFSLGSGSTVFCFGMAFYSIAYCMSSHFVYRRFLVKRLPKKKVFLLPVILFAFSSFVMALIQSMIMGNADAQFWYLLNPIALDGSLKEEALIVSGIWAVMATAIQLPWLFTNFFNFKPLPLESASPDEATSNVEATNSVEAISTGSEI